MSTIKPTPRAQFPDSATATMEELSFESDPRPHALVAAANYWSGANVPTETIVETARAFETYLTEDRALRDAAVEEATE